MVLKSKTGFIYDAKDLNKKPEKFFFSTTRNQGWGTTYDPIKKEIIVGDGSNYLHFWNPKNMQQLRTIEVYRQSGKRAKNINELEFWRGRVLANVWYEDTILVIHPETGKVEKEYGKYTQSSIASFFRLLKLTLALDCYSIP